MRIYYARIKTLISYKGHWFSQYYEPMQLLTTSIIFHPKTFIDIADSAMLISCDQFIANLFHRSNFISVWFEPSL